MYSDKKDWLILIGIIAPLALSSAWLYEVLLHGFPVWTIIFVLMVWAAAYLIVSPLLQGRVHYRDITPDMMELHVKRPANSRYNLLPKKTNIIGSILVLLLFILAFVYSYFST